MHEEFSTRSKMLFYFLKGCKRYFLLTSFFACMVSIMDLINPKIIGMTIDSIIETETQLPQWLNEMGGSSYLREHLHLVSIAILLVAMVATLCRFLFRLFDSIAAEHFVKRMRDQLFEHILRLPFSWHGENQTGDIIQRCTSDVDVIKTFLSEQLVKLFRVFLLIGFALYFMFSIHVLLALSSAIFIPIIIGYSYFFHHRIGSAFELADIEEGKLSSIAQENLTGVRVVRAFGREIYEKERFETQNESATKILIHLIRLLSAFWSSGDIFSYLQILTILSLGAYFAIHNQITAGSYITFIYYNAMLTWPVRSLGKVISSMSKAGISIDRIRYIMNAEIEQDSPNAREIDLRQDIVFENVNYQYQNGQKPILENINLTIKAGETCGILGSTGSGKSTLMYLLDKLYLLPENSGKITIGNTDINEIKSDWLRKNIGMVLQEPFLFSRTLKENIAIAQTEISQKEIEDAVRIANLEESINRFTQGYETAVGERGVTLSGGQKQRTAIAQMLIRKPPIMIFDDSLSAVDAETDTKIRESLKESTSQSTVILIAHRIATIMHADHIVVMDQGKIVQHGTHQSLLAEDGLYKRIYELQMQQKEEKYGKQ